MRLIAAAATPEHNSQLVVVHGSMSDPRFLRWLFLKYLIDDIVHMVVESVESGGESGAAAPSAFVRFDHRMLLVQLAYLMHEAVLAKASRRSCPHLLHTHPNAQSTSVLMALPAPGHWFAAGTEPDRAAAVANGEGPCRRALRWTRHRRLAQNVPSRSSRSKTSLAPRKFTLAHKRTHNIVICCSLPSRG